MPYLGENAPKLSQVTTARDLLVADALGEYAIAADAAVRPEAIAHLVRPLHDLPQGAALAAGEVATCIALDGSRQETPIMADGSRRATMCYVRVGSVTLDLEARRDLDADRFVNRVRERASRHETVLNYALPGVGISVEGLDPLESWRLATDRMLARCTLTDAALPQPTGFTLSLADALLMLYADAPGEYAEQVPVRRCPVCATDPGTPVGHVGRDGGHCEFCGGVLYLVDALGLDDMFVTNGRENALNSVMNAVERLALVATIELLRRTDPTVLGRTLVVADGPLAAIASIQRLARPILNYLDQVAAGLHTAGLPPMLVVGVEKGGNFASHGQDIAEAIPVGHAMRLPADYIARQITGRSGGRVYGAGHMYGRRFFYRRNDGDLLTVTVPASAGIAPWSKNPASEAWDSYPTLRTVLDVLESLPDLRFPGGVLPLTLAHEVSSIGLSADRVLALLAQQRLGIVQNSRLRVDRRYP